MRSILVLLLFSTTAFASLNVGTGSDGACTEASFAVGKRVYNCTSLTISGAGDTTFEGQGGAALVIRVTGSVTITGTLDIDGANGENGSAVAAINGGAGGPGASKGGTCSFASTCGQALGDNNGSGSGAGGGGREASGGDAGGGSGAGGSYGSVGGVGGQGGNTGGVGGLVGSTFGDSSGWTSSFTGGSGGGAGGRGTNFLTAPDTRGGAGGGGGGAIRIVAGGDITINGSIQAIGGQGGQAQLNAVTDGDGGHGGGGSGGAIWLQSLGNIIVAGSLTATGGTAPTSAVANYGGADGGTGGNGRIRLEDDDGVIGGGGTISPAAVTAIAGQNIVVKSGALSCGSIDTSGGSGGGQFALMFLLTLGFGFLAKKLRPSHLPKQA